MTVTNATNALRVPPSKLQADLCSASTALAHTPTPQTVLGIILGGGAGSRLYPLTKKRAKPAVPLGANYRLIDIPVSNCINSNITKIYTLTQFNSASLNRHLSQAYVGAGVDWLRGVEGVERVGSSLPKACCNGH